jgi:hypothetical protein
MCESTNKCVNAHRSELQRIHTMLLALPVVSKVSQITQGGATLACENETADTTTHKDTRLVVLTSVQRVDLVGSGYASAETRFAHLGISRRTSFSGFDQFIQKSRIALEIRVISAGLLRRKNPVFLFMCMSLGTLRRLGHRMLGNDGIFLGHRGFFALAAATRQWRNDDSFSRFVEHLDMMATFQQAGKPSV